jgi:hypothetical protein
MGPAAQKASFQPRPEEVLPALRQFARRLTGGSQAKASPPLALGQPIRLAHEVTVIPVGVRHSIAFYRAHEQPLRSMIASVDFVVLELDQERIAAQGARNAMDRDTGAFYQRLFELAWADRKPVLHVDPDTAFTTNLSWCTAAMASVLAGAGTAALIAAARSPRHVSPRALSRQAAIGAIAGSYLLTTTPGVAVVDTLVSQGLLANKPLNRFAWGNPLSLLDFRNAGAILGLARAAEEHLVHGQGYYFVGEGHLTEYQAYAENRAAAQQAYHHNIYRLLSEHVLRETPHVRLFTPKLDGTPYAFEVARSIPLQREPPDRGSAGVSRSQFSPAEC